MKRRRANQTTGPLSLQRRVCQKDGINRASGVHQYDVGHSCKGDEGIEFKIGIPGSERIFGKGKHPLRRIFWLFLATLCSFVAFYQVKGCIIKYQAEEVVKQVKILNNDTLIFPSVTMCNRCNQFNSCSIEEIQMSPDLHQMHRLTFPENEIQYSNNNISGMFKDIECWFGRNTSCEKNGYWQILHTALGPCHSFHVRQPVALTGLFNGLYIKMKLKSPLDQWVYHIHPHNVTPALRIYYETPTRAKSEMNDGLENFNTDVKINYHQVESLNLKRDPCVEDGEYTAERCELECFSEQLVRHAGCLLPFMKLSNSSPNKKSPICNSIETYGEAYKQMQLMLTDDHTIWNRTGCNCIPPCFTTYYETDKEKRTIDTKLDSFRFRVFFQTRTYEANTQILEYTLINLFCAIGNSIGLFLGVSVLTLFQALELATLKLIEWLRPRNKLLMPRIHPTPFNNPSSS